MLPLLTIRLADSSVSFTLSEEDRVEDDVVPSFLLLLLPSLSFFFLNRLVKALIFETVNYPLFYKESTSVICLLFVWTSLKSWQQQKLVARERATVQQLQTGTSSLMSVSKDQEKR